MRFLGFFPTLVVVLGLGALSPQAAHSQPPSADILYIGDNANDTIKLFDAKKGTFLGESDGPEKSGLAGPRGMVVSDGELLVVNQNVSTSIPGEVLRYSAATGTFLGALIPATDKDAPFAPDGLVLGLNQDLFVGTVSTANGNSNGALSHYALSDGAFLGAEEEGLTNKDLHVRGVVIGPDALVYASVRSLKKDGLGGAVLRYDADGDFLDVFIEDKGGFGRLNRPDGLVFGPDNRLYITSFRAAAGDTDSIRIYAADGEFAGKIDLHNGTTDTRAYAQSLLFGPGGKLFVPIVTSTNPSLSKGSVRRYNSPTTGDYVTLVTTEPESSFSPSFMSFGKTNPSTLNYDK